MQKTQLGNTGVMISAIGFGGMPLSIQGRPSEDVGRQDRKSTRLNSSHSQISYAVFCLKKKAPSVITTSPARGTVDSSWLALSSAAPRCVRPPANVIPRASGIASAPDETLKYLSW